jgi:hypothetical protein
MKMTLKPLRVIILLALATLFATPSLYLPVRGSSAGNDTVSIAPSDVVDNTKLPGTTFTQDVSISYSASVGLYPTVQALQLNFHYNSRILQVDTGFCQVVPPVTGANYCGVIPGPYALMFDTPLSTCINDNCPNSRLFLSSLSFTGVNSAGGVYSTSHWIVRGEGFTLVNGTLTPPDNSFYVTTATSPIDPSMKIYYKNTNGVMLDMPRPNDNVGSFQNVLTHDVNVGFCCIPGSPIRVGQTERLGPCVTATGSFDEDVKVTTTVNGTVIDMRTVHALSSGPPVCWTVLYTATIATHLVFCVEGFIVGFIDPTPADNQQCYVVIVKPFPLHPADLTGKGAWPDHHHFSISHYGSTEILFAKVATTGSAFISVQFMLVKDTVPIPSVSTVPFLCSGISTCEVSFGFGPLNPLTDIGHYDVTAQVVFSNDGTNFFAGASTKSFSFAVEP